MGNKTAGKHTHRFLRHRYKTGNTVYFCSLPDCYFKIDTALSLGKKSICNRCGKEFIMNKYSITLEKPHCEDCHVYKSEKTASIGRRKNARRKNDLNIVDNVIQEAAVSSISELKDRMNSVVSDTSEVESPSNVEYRPYSEDDL